MTNKKKFDDNWSARKLLRGDALKEWDRVAFTLHSRGLLDKINEVHLTMYCSMYEQFQIQKKEIAQALKNSFLISDRAYQDLDETKELIESVCGDFETAMDENGRMIIDANVLKFPESATEAGRKSKMLAEISNLIPLPFPNMLDGAALLKWQQLSPWLNERKHLKGNHREYWLARYCVWFAQREEILIDIEKASTGGASKKEIAKIFGPTLKQMEKDMKELCGLLEVECHRNGTMITH